MRILLLLGVCACLVCFGLAGWHGWRYFHRRDNTYAQKAEHAADIRDSIAIREGISHLGERDQKILNLRYFACRTQMEVSKEIGISQAQVSRLEKNALKQLEKYSM